MKPSRLLHLVANRGNAFECPENTLPALRSAFDLGARFVELDVQLSSDGVPMVIADHALSRIAGLTTHVTDMTADQLAKVDVSNPQNFGERFLGTCIPRLSDALDLLERRPEVTAFIVIGKESLARFGHEQMLPHVIRTLQPFRARYVITSTDLPAIYQARLIADYPIGWILPRYDSHTRLKFEALQPEFLLCKRDHIADTSRLWRGPWKWVIRDVETLEDSLDAAWRGAHFVSTSRVRRLSDAMRAHALTRMQARAAALHITTLVSLDRPPPVPTIFSARPSSG